MKVHELLDSKEKWIKGNWAVNSVGKACRPEDQEACKWCLLGATFRCYPQCGNGTEYTRN